MKKKLMFFGDSNTYGFDPQDFWGGRYDTDQIWTTMLQKGHPEWVVINSGQNGREIPSALDMPAGMNYKIANSRSGLFI